METPEKNVQSEIKENGEQNTVAPTVEPTAVPPTIVPPASPYISPKKILQQQLLDAPSTPKDTVWMLVLWIFGIFSANTLFTGGLHGLWIPMTTVGLYLIFFAFFGRKKLRFTSETVSMLILIVLLSFGFLLNEEPITNKVTFLTLLAAVPIHLMLCSGKSDLQKGSVFALRQTLSCIFPKTFSALKIPFLKTAGGLKKRGSGFIYALLGLLCTVPFVLLFGFLFARGDDAFAQSLDNLLQYIGIFSVGKWIGAVLVGTAAAIYLAALSFVLRDSEAEAARQTHFNGILPAQAVSSFLAVLIALEMYFGGIQIKYLFLNLGTLPEGETYADYARSGFFEIAAATLLTIFLIFLAALLVRKKDGDNQIPLSVRVLLTVFSGCVCLMFASAYYRMFMYIGACALTVKRVAVCWLMAVFLLILFGVLVQIWRRNFPLMRYVVFAVLLCVLALNSADLGYTVPKYNVERWKAQTQADAEIQLDMQYLKSLLPASAPALCALENTEYWNGDLQHSLNMLESDISSAPWQSKTADSLRAARICAELPDLDSEKMRSYSVEILFDESLENQVQCLNYILCANGTVLESGEISCADGIRFGGGESASHSIYLSKYNLSEITPQDIYIRYSVVLQDGTSHEIPSEVELPREGSEKYRLCKTAAGKYWLSAVYAR